MATCIAQRHLTNGACWYTTVNSFVTCPKSRFSISQMHSDRARGPETWGLNLRYRWACTDLRACCCCHSNWSIEPLFDRSDFGRMAYAIALRLGTCVQSVGSMTVGTGSLQPQPRQKGERDGLLLAKARPTTGGRSHKPSLGTCSKATRPCLPAMSGSAGTLESVLDATEADISNKRILHEKARRAEWRNAARIGTAAKRNGHRARTESAPRRRESARRGQHLRQRGSAP
jgi:hypothetical protein